MSFPKYKAVAPSASVIKGDHYRFTILTPALIRMEWSEDGEFEERPSYFAVHRDFPPVEFKVKESGNRVDIFTSQTWIQYVKGPFGPGTLTAEQLNLPYGHRGYQWRYDEPQKGHRNTQGSNLGGTVRTLDSLNGRTDMGNGILNGPDGWVGSRKEGRYDGYLWSHGLDYHWALRDFFTLSGRAPVPPRYSLGIWFTRFHPYTDKEYLGIMDRFLEEGVPLAVAAIDIAWHIMEKVPKGQGGTWSGFTWEKDLFPDPPAFLKALHDRGIIAALNDHPNGGVRYFEERYEEVCKFLGLDASKKDPIPFDVTDRQIMDAYFKVILHDLEKQGVDLWWLDWQQNDQSVMKNVDPLWILNHYHFLDHGKDGRRAMTLSRYAGPGSHRYPLGFSGDHEMTWDSLNFQPEFTATASNIGYGWWSHDIGGHLGGTKDDERTARWAQLAVVLPIVRLHNSDNPFNYRTPWDYATEEGKSMVKSYRLRHRLIPYIYTSAMNASLEYRTLIEPMYYEWPMYANAYDHKNAYMFGKQLLAAPITQPKSQVTQLGKSTAWLPPGTWVDIFAGLVYDGDRIVDFHRSIQEIPIFATQGSIIPMDAFDKAKHGVELPKAIEITLIVGADGEFTLIEDDGTGNDMTKVAYSETLITYKGGKLTIGPAYDSFLESRHWSLWLPACNLNHVKIEGKAASATASAEGSQITIGEFKTKSIITVDLGSPTLRPNDWKAICRQRIDLAHTSMDKKAVTWKAVQSVFNSIMFWLDGDPQDLPRHVIISRLLAVKADPELVDALLELLLAEDRK